MREVAYESERMNVRSEVRNCRWTRLQPQRTNRVLPGDRSRPDVVISSPAACINVGQCQHNWPLPKKALLVAAISASRSTLSSALPSSSSLPVYLVSIFSTYPINVAQVKPHSAAILLLLYPVSNFLKLKFAFLNVCVYLYFVLLFVLLLLAWLAFYEPESSCLPYTTAANYVDHRST